MQPKTGASIKQSIENTWSSLGLPVEELVQNCCFVTDQGAIFKVALSNFTRQPCACHMIGTIVKHTLQLDNLSKSITPMEEGDLDMEHVRSIKDCVSDR